MPDNDRIPNIDERLDLLRKLGLAAPESKSPVGISVTVQGDVHIHIAAPDGEGK